MGSKFGTARKIILGIGIAFAIVTVASGISGWIFSSSQVDHSTKTREVFVGIPGSLIVVFYIVVPILLVYGAVLFAQRTKNWERGRPDNRATTSARTSSGASRDFRAGVYMQTLLRDPAAGIMHSLIYFSFLVLLGGHHGARDQPPAADQPQVPARQRVRGLLVRRRPGRARPSSSAWCGPSCAATSSGPTASASRPSPSTR